MITARSHEKRYIEDKRPFSGNDGKNRVPLTTVVWLRYEIRRAPSTAVGYVNEPDRDNGMRCSWFTGPLTRPEVPSRSYRLTSIGRRYRPPESSRLVSPAGPKSEPKRALVRRHKTLDRFPVYPAISPRDEEDHEDDLRAPEEAAS
ncbi:hypothetical protein KM043_010893 [Ampulex compressa]|nr:hypothetical protein KM043_010893 [Ampulex compressa]